MFEGPDPGHQRIVLLLISVGYLVTQVPTTQVTPITPTLVGLASLGPSLTYAAFFVVVFGLGAGLGTVNTVNDTVIMTSLPGQDRGFAAGMLEPSRPLVA